MAKTHETRLLENALDLQAKKTRSYGCEEVTIGFSHQGLGDEIVDFMTMDAGGVICCYEIKVTLSDLKSSHKMSFYGDYNYLVISPSLYARNPVYANYIPPYAGILVGEDLVVKRQAKRKTIDDDTRQMLKDSLLRSVFWKYEKYKDAKDLQKQQKLIKDFEQAQQTIQTLQRENERKIWTYDDYEHFYALNHQLPSFSLEQAAKLERQQYFQRQKGEYTWLKGKTKAYCCPVCQNESDEKTSFCPHCGTDLRKL